MCLSLRNWLEAECMSSCQTPTGITQINRHTLTDIHILILCISYHFLNTHHKNKSRERKKQSQKIYTHRMYIQGDIRIVKDFGWQNRQQQEYNWMYNTQVGWHLCRCCEPFMPSQQQVHPSVSLLPSGTSVIRRDITDRKTATKPSHIKTLISTRCSAFKTSPPGAPHSPVQRCSLPSQSAVGYCPEDTLAS